jgi:hypothetical protein
MSRGRPKGSLVGPHFSVVKHYTAIAKLRIRLGLTQSRAAYFCDVSLRTYQSYERGFLNAGSFFSEAYFLDRLHRSNQIKQTPGPCLI